MAHTRCETCKGRKEVVGLGSMTHKCRVCNGVGYVAIPEPEPVEPVVVVTACTMPDSSNTKRKYVRKSKVVADE